MPRSGLLPPRPSNTDQYPSPFSGRSAHGEFLPGYARRLSITPADLPLETWAFPCENLTEPGIGRGTPAVRPLIPPPRAQARELEDVTGTANHQGVLRPSGGGPRGRDELFLRPPFRARTPAARPVPARHGRAARPLLPRPHPHRLEPGQPRRPRQPPPPPRPRPPQARRPARALPRGRDRAAGHPADLRRRRVDRRGRGRLDPRLPVRRRHHDRRRRAGRGRPPALVGRRDHRPRPPRPRPRRPHPPPRAAAALPARPARERPDRPVAPRLAALLHRQRAPPGRDAE